MPDHRRLVEPRQFQQDVRLDPVRVDDCWIEFAEQDPQASRVPADRQAHRHGLDQKPADLAEPSPVPEPGVSEGRQGLRECQHVNCHPDRFGLPDERTIARYDEMALDARDRLGDTRHEIEKTQLRATNLADRIEVDNSHFKTMRRQRAKKLPEGIVSGIAAHPKYRRL